LGPEVSDALHHALADLPALGASHARQREGYALLFPLHGEATGSGAVAGYALPGDGRVGKVRRIPARDARGAVAGHDGGILLPGRVRPAAAPTDVRVRAHQR